MNEALKIPQLSAAAAIFFQLLLHRIISDIMYEREQVAGRIPERLDMEESEKQNPYLCFSVLVESTFFSKCSILQIPTSQSQQMEDKE